MTAFDLSCDGRSPSKRYLMDCQSQPSVSATFSPTLLSSRLLAHPSLPGVDHVPTANAEPLLEVARAAVDAAKRAQHVQHITVDSEFLAGLPSGTHLQHGLRQLQGICISQIFKACTFVALRSLWLKHTMPVPASLTHAHCKLQRRVLPLTACNNFSACWPALHDW